MQAQKSDALETVRSVFGPAAVIKGLGIGLGREVAYRARGARGRRRAPLRCLSGCPVSPNPLP